MGADFFAQETGCGACVGRVPCDQDRVGLESLELAGEHLMICISADEDYIIKVSVECHFVCVKSEPCVHALFNHAALRVLAEMFVVEDYVVLDKAVLKLSFRMQKISSFCIVDSVASSVIVTFCYV